MKSTDICQDVLKRLRQWQMRLVLQRLVFTATASSVLVATALLLEIPPATWLLQLAVLVIVSFVHLVFSHKWRQLIPENFLQHLNRRFPDFEESAQLLIKEDSDLSPMRKLQRNRARAVYTGNLARLEQWRPLIKYRPATAVILFFVLIAMTSSQLRLLTDRWLSAPPVFTTAARTTAGTTQITHMAISIQPPEYTGLPANETDLPNLDIVEGSLVQWDLAFNSKADHYFLQLSDGQKIDLSPVADGHWYASSTILRTDLYRIIGKTADQETSIGDIYALTVTLDQVPDVRILVPDTSSLEIPKQGSPTFSSSVLITDDYGVQSAGILASVAKGSGEGVKFRDQELSFDQSEKTDRGTLYQREWDLQSLGMEPGDEIYFTVVATDNKQPTANTGRSETVIVRWLEDEQTGLAAEGLAIDFIPEFFKSQRQIIIDTEQLLEDQKSLELQTFKDTSYEIGQAQADLKQKYGQYLGDEFGAGPGEQLGIMHEIAESRENEPGGDEPGGDKSGPDEHGHEESASINTRISTTAEILELFGHNHGDPEIGPITKRNPVALMKRAVSEMWQAEKHLMQAEPEQALPFEYEAYKYLKLARQADRIYVKRLGFEPPPVSEDRRLTGELDEILTYQLSEDSNAVEQTGPRADQRLLRDAYNLLSTQTPAAELTTAQRALLIRLSAHLMTLSEKRPALIKQAATVEKLLLAGRHQIDACPDCITELNTTLWNLMDEGTALFHQGKAAYYPGDDLIRSYQDELQKTVLAPEISEGGAP